MVAVMGVGGRRMWGLGGRGHTLASFLYERFAIVVRKMWCSGGGGGGVLWRGFGGEEV